MTAMTDDTDDTDDVAARAEADQLMARHRKPGGDIATVIRSMTDVEIQRLNELGQTIGPDALKELAREHADDGRDPAQRIVDHVDAHGSPGSWRDLHTAVGQVTEADVRAATDRIRQRTGEQAEGNA